jgi:nucleoside-diphosphate-sugar epimerase
VLDLAPEVYQRETDPMLSHINVGTGTDVTIRELAETLAEVTGFAGRLSFDRSKPDGTPRKLMDVSRLARLGWTAQIGLREGLAETYDWFRAQGLDAVRAK